MKSVLESLINNNKESINSFFVKKLDEINYVDPNWHGDFDIKIDQSKIDRFDEKYLFAHLLIIRTIAQISLNLHRNISFYENIEFNCSNLVDCIEDNEDKKYYETFLRVLNDQRKSSDNSYLETVKSIISTYLIISKMLLSKEEQKGSSPLTYRKISVETDSLIPGNINPRSFDCSKPKDDLLTIGDCTWKCGYCDEENDRTRNKCSSCNAGRFDLVMESRKDIAKVKIESRNKTNVSTLATNDHNKESPVHLSKTNDEVMECDRSESMNFGNVDGRSLGDPCHSNNDREMCHRCKSKLINICNSQICGDCANTLFYEEKTRKERSESMTVDTDNNMDTLPSDILSCSQHNYIGPIKHHERDNTEINDKWKCGECTKMNSFDDDKCSLCGGNGPHYDKWRCEHCSVINKKLNTNCGTCFQLNPFIQRCPRCHRNDINSKYSKVCDDCITGDMYTERMDSAIYSSSVNINVTNTPYEHKDNESLGMDGWSCSKCSRYYSFDLVKCAACHIPGPHINKWMCGQCTKWNLYDEDKCSLCGGYGPHYDKWRCEHCTVINNKLDIGCATCSKLNPFIQRCPRCFIKDINSKYGKVCDDCITGEIKYQQMDIDRRMAAIDITENIINTPRQDGWSCPQCSLHNVFDLVECAECSTVGPHNDKWKCDKCTCLNDRWSNWCSACNEYQRIRNIFTISPPYLTNDGNDGDNTKNSEALLIDGTKYGSANDKSSCANCTEYLSDKDYKLCRICKDKYYICGNAKCNTIYNKEITFCPKCGIKQYSCLSIGGIVECCIDGQIKKVWQCSFQKCMQLNSEYCYNCSVCDCPKRLSQYDKRCLYCGWMNYYGYSKCAKCNDKYVP